MEDVLSCLLLSLVVPDTCSTIVKMLWQFVKKFGYPDLFITITCNVNWSEIREFVLAKGLSALDRPDIVCRVFKMKLDEMMTDFKEKIALEKPLQVCYI